MKVLSKTQINSALLAIIGQYTAKTLADINCAILTHRALSSLSTVAILRPKKAASDWDVKDQFKSKYSNDTSADLSSYLTQILLNLMQVKFQTNLKMRVFEVWSYLGELSENSDYTATMYLPD